MAEYYMPYRVPLTIGGDYYGLRYVRTFGRRKPPRMDPWVRIAKKRMNNPHLWAQLEAASKGTYVNHLGRGHTRSPQSTYYYD